MAKTRIERIAEIEAQVAQMLNAKKELLAAQKEADRKARNHRICERGGYIESVLTETAGLTISQFKEFIGKTLLTEFAKRELAKISRYTSEIPAEKAADIKTAPETPSVSKIPSANAQDKQ